MFSGQVVKYRACGKKPSENLDGNNCEDFQYADPSVTDVKKCYCEGDRCNSNLSPGNIGILRGDVSILRVVVHNFIRFLKNLFSAKIY